jgi:hypothetical protein
VRSGVVDPDHPANAAVLRRLARSTPDAAPDGTVRVSGLAITCIQGEVEL